MYARPVNSNEFRGFYREQHVKTLTKLALFLRIYDMEKYIHAAKAAFSSPWNDRTRLDLKRTG